MSKDECRACKKVKIKLSGIKEQNLTANLVEIGHIIDSHQAEPTTDDDLAIALFLAPIKANLLSIKNESTSVSITELVDDSIYRLANIKNLLASRSVDVVGLRKNLIRAIQWDLFNMDNMMEKDFSDEVKTEFQKVDNLITEYMKPYKTT